MPSPRPTGPAKCPMCGCPTVRMQVIAWALFRDGKYETVDLAEYIEWNQSAPAQCDNDAIATPGRFGRAEERGTMTALSDELKRRKMEAHGLRDEAELLAFEAVGDILHRQWLYESVSPGYGDRRQAVRHLGDVIRRAMAAAGLRELEAGGWRPRAAAADTDDPILGYSPIAGNPAEDEQAGHYAITSGSFLLSGGWENCTLWQPLAPPGTSDGGGK